MPKGIPKGSISYNVRNLEAVQAFLKSIPKGGMKAVLEAMVIYFIGDASHGLVHYEPYKYVSRAKAYGSTGATFENGKPVPPGYFSAKQFRYVMAKIASGDITPGTENRTGTTAAGWQYVKMNDWQYRITNPEKGAYYTRGEPGQARLNALVGWRQMSKVIADNFKGAMRSGMAALNAWIKQKGAK